MAPFISDSNYRLSLQNKEVTTPEQLLILTTQHRVTGSSKATNITKGSTTVYTHYTFSYPSLPIKKGSYTHIFIYLYP